MNKMKLKYQIGLFGNFDDIKQTPDTVKKLMEVMQKFDSYTLLLNTMTEITLNAKTGTPTQVNRISFVDQNSGLQIMFGSKRLDFIKELRDDNSNNMGELADYIKLVKDIIVELSDTFIDFKNFNRLSLLTDCFINDISIAKKESIYKKLLNETFFRNENIKEWSVQIVNKDEGKELKEKINNILSINRLQGQLIINNHGKDIDGIKVMIDINTKAEDLDFRFNIDSINNFLIDSLEKNTLISNEINNKLLED